MLKVLSMNLKAFMNNLVNVFSEANHEIIFLNTWPANSATWNENQSNRLHWL